MSGQPEVITIERLGRHGDGIGPGPVFVPRTLPGEVVTGKVENRRIAVPKILAPVSDRVRPPCPHYKNCGGCELQHASDQFVAGWKRIVVEKALQAQGLPAPVRHIATSPVSSRRRATVAARRLKKGAQAGFYGRRSETITDISSCLLLRPELIAVLPLVCELAFAGGSRKSRLAVTLTLLDEGIDVAVTGGKPLTPALFSEVAGIAGNAGGVARLSWEGDPVATFLPAVLTLGKAQVTVPPGAFLQATCEGEEALIAAVSEAVGGARYVADLFAGCGTFTLPLAQGVPVHAVEGSEDMLSSLAAGWRKTEGLKAVSTEKRDLFRRPLLPDELNGFEAVIVDPPRAGAGAQVAEIARSDVARVAMVSCNPATLAQDLNVLCKAGYHIEWIDIVDQFRWSSHVEAVACLKRPA